MEVVLMKVRKVGSCKVNKSWNFGLNLKHPEEGKIDHSYSKREERRKRKEN
jgi:hypothetical protein